MSDAQRFDQIQPTSAKAPKERFTRPLPIKLAVAGMLIGALMAALNIAVAYVETVAANRARYEDFGVNEVAMEHLVHTGVWLAVGVATVFALAEIVLWVAMALTNLHGFKWARIVATVLGILGLFLTTGSIVTSVIYDTVIGLSAAHTIVAQVLAITILVLLWLPGSSSYYQTRTLDRARRITREAMLKE